jgi:tetratricopeptide (TPR) repeat protein
MSSHNGDSDFLSKASQDWDLARLFGDMEAKHFKKLTPAQQRNLKFILLGLSPKEAAKILNVEETSLKPAFSGVYRLVEDLTEHPDKSVTYKNASIVLAKYRKGAIAASAKFDLLGRDDDRVALQNLSQKCKIVLIKAGAGVGKSTLAREFLQTQFTKVIRLEMGLESDNVTPAAEKVSQILRKDFDEDPSLDFGINLDLLRSQLSDRDNPIGVLIDNLEPALDENYRFRERLRGYEALLSVLGDRDVCSFTLITSRRSLIAQRVTVREYLLGGLDHIAWQEYFHDCKDVENSEALFQMCDAYSGNAKVMGILHSAVKNRFDDNIGAYWNRYQNALLADSELKSLISVEMDWLRDHQPEAYSLLCRMSCYRYQDVKTVPFEGLTCLLWDVEYSKHSWVIEYLRKTSLIEAKDTYYLHPAVRESALERLKIDNTDWERINIITAEFWANHIDIIETVEDALMAFESYHHYVAISNNELAAKVIVKLKRNKWNDEAPLGTLLYICGLLDSVRNAIYVVLNDTKDGLDASRIHNILGDLCWLAGDPYQAIESHEKSRKIAIKFDLTALEAVSFFNVGLCQIDLWEIELAIEQFEKCVAISESGIHRRYTIGSYHCLSFLYSAIGFENKSIDFANKFFKEIDLDNLSTWSLGYRWLFLGRAYINLLNFQKALEMYKNALTYAEEIKYPQVKGNSFIGLAIIARIEKNWNQANFHHHSSIDILRNLGAKSDLAEAYFQFGLTYQAMGDDRQAEDYKEKALDLFGQMQAPKQIDRVHRAFEQGAINRSPLQ